MVTAQSVDVEAVLEDDRRVGRQLPRIGIRQDVSYQTKDGKFEEKGNYYLWNLTIQSEKAKSLSIGFENTHLPEGAIMYLYNEKTKFIIGPIRNEIFQEKTFVSDYADGESVTISIIIPNSTSINKFNIYVNTLFFGLDSYKIYDNDFERSGSCNINVACESEWKCQKESVCKIITGTGRCSGALMNTDCCDLEPYILTANHCLGTPTSNPNTWNFRFNYQSPQCSPNTENSPAEWITFFGATMKSSWDFNSGTDFLLLELNSEISQRDNVSFAGWDRTNSTTPNSFGIHHPLGDVKKICYDTDPSTFVGDYHRVVWNNGTTEPGSSGSPLFNNNAKIIGQLQGGTASCTNQNSPDRYGRLDVSWEGNGTSTGRLRDWLGGSSNMITIDCMEYPEISGPDVLCTSNKTFVLVNNMPCTKNVQWEVTPSNLLFSSASGDGNIATIRAKSNVKGSATIKYTLTSNGCTPVEVEKDFWIGSPKVLTNYPDPTICLNQFEEITIPESIQATNYRLQSLSPNLSIFNNSPTPYEPIDIIGNRVGIFTLQLTAENECGSSSALIYVEVEKCGSQGGGYEDSGESSQLEAEEIDIEVFPNPANDFINVSCSECLPNTKIKISMLSSNGKLLREIETNGTIINIDTKNILAGLYILKCEIDGNFFHKKILKL